jgi:hypothetical protein
LTEAIVLVQDSASNRRLGVGSSASGQWIQSSYPGTDGIASTLLLNPSGGNVGIGVTAPNQIVTANGYMASWGSNAGYLLYDSTGATYWGGIEKVGNNIQVGTNQSQPLLFNTGNSERARFDTSGRLLVGTSTGRNVGTVYQARLQIETTQYAGLSIVNNTSDTGPALLSLAKSRGTSAGATNLVQANDVLGAIAFSGADGTDTETVAADISVQVDGTPGTNDMPGRLVFSTTADGASSPTERMRITQNGTVLIGITTSYSGNGITLSPTGSTTIRNQTTGTQEAFGVSTGTYDPAFFVKGNGGINNYSANNVNLSDRNAKKDITPAADTWNCLKEWEIVNYRYKDQPADADLSLGVIAQQVAQNCPEVITVFQEAKEATEDAPAQEERLGVKEQQMYWMAIKALQEAQLRIETLEAKVAALEGA